MHAAVLDSPVLCFLVGPNGGQTVFHFDDRDREYRQRYVHVRLLEEGHTDDADDQRVGGGGGSRGGAGTTRARTTKEVVPDVQLV